MLAIISQQGINNPNSLIRSFPAPHTTPLASDLASVGAYIDVGANDGGPGPMRRVRVGSPVELNESEIDVLRNAGFTVTVQQEGA